MLSAPDGEMLGVMSVAAGVAAAEEFGLDLVEVSPHAKPPVCKILDYGKYKYEQQKKAAEARKKQKTVDVKEIKVRPNIEDHDYGVKLKAAKKFLTNEDKVKVTLRFRGREMAHKDLAAKLLDRIRDDLADLSKVEFHPKMEGRQMIMILAPDKIAVEKAIHAKKPKSKRPQKKPPSTMPNKNDASIEKEESSKEEGAKEEEKDCNFVIFLFYSKN